MKKISGVNLFDYLARNKDSLDEFSKLKILLAILDALDSLHKKKGIIHGDLHPKNILLEEKDGVYKARIIDFGHACRSGKPISVTNKFCHYYSADRNHWANDKPIPLARPYHDIFSLATGLLEVSINFDFLRQAVTEPVTFSTFINQALNAFSNALTLKLTALNPAEIMRFINLSAAEINAALRDNSLLNGISGSHVTIITSKIYDLLNPLQDIDDYCTQSFILADIETLTAAREKLKTIPSFSTRIDNISDDALTILLKVCHTYYTTILKDFFTAYSDDLDTILYFNFAAGDLLEI